MNLEEALFYSKLIIKNGDYYSGVRFRKYSQGYLGTTENIGYYLEKEKFKNNRAFTILGSGDHVFNLIFKGFKEIDAIDINRLEYYVYYLRKAMILCLAYKDFIKGHTLFNNFYITDLLELIEKLKSYLPEDVYEYYRKILEFAKIKRNL